MPFAACMPPMSSGDVSRRTRITSTPRPDHSSASSAVKTIRPLTAPGEAGSPRASTCRSASGSKVGCSSWSSWPGSTRRRAVVSSIRPSSSISTAMRTAAAAVRFPVRVWSM